MTEGDDDKTVFQPSSAGDPAAQGTVIAPSPAPSLPPTDTTVIVPAGAAGDATVFAAPAPTRADPPPAPPAAPRSRVGVQPGDILNHMFEVKRFLARGGMGEVFEGVNVASDERVAIKVILPQLAADPNVTAMFRKEAQTLTRLSHPALVQYRVLAQEPALGVFYIVTEFIDGANLADVLGQVRPSGPELIGLARRLAEGLRAAHELGAIHRDISPDNVLLAGGKLERARIIDFGIAKDIDPGSKTIVGDGFAGKLGYVAPEQLGDFGRDVGPWTDVYSLGLVLLAVAAGKGPDMGGSFVDAIDKRRRGVDIAAAPPELRPVLDRMLAADPAQRIRSMDELIAALAAVRNTSPHDEKIDGGGKKVTPKPVGGLPRPALIGGAAAGALALVAGIGWIAFGGSDNRPPEPPAAARPPVAGAAPVEAVRRAVEVALPQVPCSWLSLSAASARAGGAELGFTGVAGRPAEAEAAVFKAVGDAGGAVASSDFSGVAPVDASFCPALDGLRPIRVAGSAHLTASQPRYEIARFTDGEYQGQLGARVILDFDLQDLPDDFALFGVEGNGEVSPIVPSRRQFLAAASSGQGVERLPGLERYRISTDAVRSKGWAGVLLLSGKGGFDAADLQGAGKPGWSERFAKAAAANGWKAEMIWFKFVDEAPN